MSVARVKEKQGRGRFALLEHERTWSTSSVLARVAVLIPLMVLPWLFGGVHASSQLFLVAGVSTALVCWLVGSGSQSISPTSCLIPLLLAVALGAAQLIPANPRVLEQVSPRSFDFWQMFAPAYANTNSDGYSDSDDSTSAAAKEESQFAMDVGFVQAGPANTVSLYPASTRHDLVMLVLAIAVFFLGSQLFGRASSQFPLFACVAATGAALALFGIVQQLTWNGMIYGRFPLTNGGVPFASFVNRNNAAGFLNLCLACAIGFTLWVFARDGRDQYRSASSPLRRAWDGIVEFMAGLNGQKLFALLAMIAIGAGLLASLSRGGWVSIFAALVVLMLTLQASHRFSLRLLVIPLVMALAVGMVFWIGKGDAVNERYDLLRLQVSSPTDPRLETWREGLAAGRDFWLVGSGLGTYRYIYRPYSQVGRNSWCYHAENQYLEAFVEGGILGLALMLGVLAAVATACWRLLQEPRSSADYICGVVGVYALASQATHAMFDFGLYITANTALFALICGMVTGCAARVQFRTHRHRGRHFTFKLLTIPANRTLFTSLATALLCLTLFGSLEIQSAGAVESALRATRQDDAPADKTISDLSNRISEMGAAVAQRPDDAEAHLRLAQLQIHRYRLQAVQGLREQSPEEVSDEQLWELTTPTSLHAIVRRLEKQGQTFELTKLRRAPAVQTDLQHAVRHLYHAAAACPLLPRVPLLLAEIGEVVSKRSLDTVQLARARRLVVSKYDLMTECAQIALQAGRTDEAIADLHRSMSISPHSLPTVLRVLAQHIDAAAAVRVAPYSADLFLDLLRKDFASESDAAMRMALIERAVEQSSTIQPDESQNLFWQGMWYGVKGEYQTAINSIRGAVERQPEMTAWRYELALLLQANRQVVDAREHARICVRMEPNVSRFNALLKELIRASLTTR